MKHFVVQSSPTDAFSAVVIATGLDGPQEELAQVEEELRRRRHVSGQVVFDLLTANGTKTRRFFSIGFDGERFPKVQFQRVEPDEAIRSASARFFCRHADEVNLSLLSPAMRFAVSQGIEI